MMTPSLVVLTTGPACYNPFQALTPPDDPARVAQVGILDGMSTPQILAAFAAEPEEAAIMLRLPPGERVWLSLSRLQHAFQQKINQLEAQGVESIVLCYSPEMPPLTAAHAVLMDAGRLLPTLMTGILGGRKGGILLPDEALIPAQRKRWQNTPSPPCFAAACPWQSDDNGLYDAGLALQEQGAEAIVIDCPGFTPRHRARLQALLGIPVLLTTEMLLSLAHEVAA
ncbi:AroM family protein [Pantoea sp. 1.19]|uniref:AroM family protein n=1 Tax=Pantoea sp. 1.19 TaxID=1925589 RepID=UPI000948E6D4|nr:AroM family protein [Pantoea sp. 1.19]